MASEAKRKVLFSRGLSFLRPQFEDYEVLMWPKDGLEAFVAEHCADVRAVVAGGARRLPAPIETLPSLGLVAIVGSGYEGIAAENYLARGVEVTNAPGANAPDVADHAVALLLALVREVVEGDRRMRAGLWVDPRSVERIRSIRNLRVGIVGMGAIGVGIAHRIAAFGSPISWWGPRPKPEIDYPRAETLLQLAEMSDVLFLALRADASNRGVIDAGVLAALGPQGVLVNVSRGSVVDELALKSALTSGAVGGAALDVYSTEPVLDRSWDGVPNTVLTPHLGGAGLGAWDNQVAIVRENLERFFSGSPLATPIPR